MSEQRLSENIWNKGTECALEIPVRNSDCKMSRYLKFSDAVRNSECSATLIAVLSVILLFFCAEYEDVGSGFINSQRKSDTEEELLKIGSEDDEADDNIRAAVENVITNELAEDKITRNSRDKNERSSPETKLNNPDSSEMTDTPTGLKGKPIANHDANGNTDISLNLCNDSKKEVMNLQSETYLNGSLQSSYQENSQSSLETGSVGNNCNVSSKPRILLKIKQTANKGDKFSTTYDAKSVQT